MELPLVRKPESSINEICQEIPLSEDEFQNNFVPLDIQLDNNKNKNNKKNISIANQNKSNWLQMMRENTNHEKLITTFSQPEISKDGGTKKHENNINNEKKMTNINSSLSELKAVHEQQIMAREPETNTNINQVINVQGNLKPNPDVNMNALAVNNNVAGALSMNNISEFNEKEESEEIVYAIRTNIETIIEYSELLVKIIQDEFIDTVLVRVNELKQKAHLIKESWLQETRKGGWTKEFLRGFGMGPDQIDEVQLNLNRFDIITQKTVTKGDVAIAVSANQPQLFDLGTDFICKYIKKIYYYYYIIYEINM